MGGDLILGFAGFICLFLFLFKLGCWERDDRLLPVRSRDHRPTAMRLSCY